MLDPAHTARLRERKLDPVLAMQCGLRSHAGAIAFDYRRQAALHNSKLRRGKGNMPWQLTGKDLILWNVDSLSLPHGPAGTEAVIITEGEFDALAAIQVGFPRTVSVPNGAPSRADESGDQRYTYLYESKAKDAPLIKPLRECIEAGMPIVLAVDGDGPGQALRDALAARIGEEHCLWVQWPEGCKDANDVLIKHGPEMLCSTLLGAKRMWLDYVARMGDIPDRQPDVMLTLGHRYMDDEVFMGGIRLPSTGFVTISGPAGHGKSVFARQLLWNLWKQHRLPFSITALEEAAKPRYQRDFRRLAIGEPIAKWDRDLVARADIEIDNAMTIIQRPPRGLLDVETLLGIVEYTIKAYGTRVICIDPANEIDRDYEKNNQADQIGKLIMELKGLADRYQVLIMVIAHPPADVVRKKRPDQTWNLYEVEGSRHWAGKSDAGFMLWRPGAGIGSNAILHACKLKDNETSGRPNLFELAHDPSMNTYTCVDRGFEAIMGKVIAAVEDAKTFRRSGG